MRTQLAEAAFESANLCFEFRTGCLALTNMLPVKPGKPRKGLHTILAFGSAVPKRCSEDLVSSVRMKPRVASPKVSTTLSWSW